MQDWPVKVDVWQVYIYTFISPEATAIEDGQHGPVPAPEGFLLFYKVVGFCSACWSGFFVTGFEQVFDFFCGEPL